MLERLSQYAGVTELELVDYDGELSLLGTLALWDELTLDLPLVDGVQLVLGQPGLNLTALTSSWISVRRPARSQVASPSWHWTRSSRSPGLKLRPMRPKEAADSVFVVVCPRDQQCARA